MEGISLGEVITIVLAALGIYIPINKNRKQKLELLYNEVIAPSYTTFFRASSLYLCQNNLSKESQKNKDKLITTPNDYIALRNNIDRHMAVYSKFCKQSRVYKPLILLRNECDERLSDKWHKIYSKEEFKDIEKRIINPLYEIYKKQ